MLGICRLKLLFDLTTTLGRAYDPPSGTTRVERTILSDLIAALGANNISGINHDRGRFVAISAEESRLMLEIAASPGQQAARPPSPATPSGHFRGVGFANVNASIFRRFPSLRGLGQLYLQLFSRSARPAAAQGAWELFSGTVLTLKAIKRSFAALLQIGRAHV